MFAKQLRLCNLFKGFRRQRHDAPVRRHGLSTLERLEDRAVPAQYFVNTPGDSSFGTVGFDVNGVGYGDLRGCAFSASTNSDLNDVITFNPGISAVTLTGRVAVLQNNGGSITFQGPVSGDNSGVAISATGGNGALDVAGGTFAAFNCIFRDLTISNCNVSTDSSGAIPVQGAANVVLNNARLTGNTVQTGNGGGISMLGTGNLTVDHSIVELNRADNGGGIYAGPNGGTVSVVASNIAQNSADAGGGVYHGSDSTMNFVQSTVFGNDAHDGGGVANGSAGVIQFTKCNITGNSATDHGGGVANEALGTITAVSSQFGSNTAGSFGGGLHNQSGGAINLTKCSVLNNLVTDHTYSTSSGGGGIASLDASGHVSIDYCAIGMNDGYAGGGVLAFGNLYAQSSSIWNNIGRNGGGFLLAGEGNEIVQCTIANNTATCGAGIHTLADTEFKVYNSTIVYNHGVWDHGHPIGEGIWAEQGTYMTLFSTIAAENGSDSLRPNGISNQSYNPVQANYNLIEGDLFIGHTYTSTSGNNHDDFLDLIQVPYAMAGVPGIDPTGNGTSGLPVPELYSADPPTWMPVYEGGKTDDVTYPLVPDQRGVPFSRHVGAVDIGAYEHDTTVDGRIIRLPYTNHPVQYWNIGRLIDVSTIANSSLVLLDLSSADDFDIVIEGPDGFRESAKFVSSSQGTLPNEIVLHYQFTPPSGQFDSSDNGLYYVRLMPNQLFSMDKTAVPAAAVQTLFVEIPRTLPVTNTSDSGPGSLRDAVQQANQVSTGIDQIVFDPGVFSMPRTITLTSGELPLTDWLTIVGPGAALATISGNNASRVFHVDIPGVGDVSLSGLTITKGKTTANDGQAIRLENDNLTIMNCVFNQNGSTGTAGGALATIAGYLKVIHSTLTNNTASQGGAIRIGTGAQVDLVRCTLSGNTADNGGAISGNGGSLTIVDSTLSNNTATGAGGGGAIEGTTTAITVLNSTLSGNVANNALGLGGAIVLSGAGSLNVFSSTITNNSANGAGGGGISIGDTSAVVGLWSSIVAQNSNTSHPDLHSTSTVSIDGDNNLVGVTVPGAKYTLAGSSNLTGTLPSPLDAKLAPLANNGGSTLTHALLPGSPAINAGLSSPGMANDQRGLGFARVVGGGADIGAFEMQAPAKVVSVKINDGSAQRSRVTSVTLAFSQIVVFSGAPAAAFDLIRQTDNKHPTLSALIDNSGSGTVVTLTFSGANAVDFGSLADGRYTLTVFASQVSNSGVPLDGNGDGVGGDNYVLIDNPANAPRLFRLFGDADGDGDVDTTDFAAFRAAFGGSNNVSDFDNDGDVDTSDFGQFRARFGMMI